MPHALIGIKKDTKADVRQSVTCIKDGFATEDEAEAFAAEYNETTERREQYSDLYVEWYEGRHWVPAGGRCFYYARRALYEQFERLQSLCPKDIEPCVRYGERDLIGPDDKIVRGRHGWVEAWNTVYDCGSYVYNLRKYDKEEYYKLFHVVPDESFSIDEIRKTFQ